MTDAAQAKADKENAYWARHRQDVTEAEAELEAKGTPSKLKVKELKALIISRTGSGPKATNNKAPEFPILKEARAAMAANAESKCPDENEPLLIGDVGADAAAAAAAEGSDGSDDDDGSELEEQMEAG